MKKHLFFLLALVLIFSGTVYADLYSWEDESGVKHFTDYPPAVKKGKNVKVLQNDSGTSEEKPSPDAEKAPSIKLFTKNDCPDCDKAREYLTSQKLAFTEYNMDTDPKSAAARKEIDDGDDVPFAVVGRSHVYGFSETVYQRALKQSR
ncbi:MAG: glutaredoxin family protein [Smithellaceae bacterium]|nr:glutaredoxin family protein [Smithellaceae bacterium]